MFVQLASSFYFKNCKYNGKPARLEDPIPSLDSSIAFFFPKRLQFLLALLLAACFSPTDPVTSSPKCGHFLRKRFWAGPWDSFQQQPQHEATEAVGSEQSGSGPGGGRQWGMWTHSLGGLAQFWCCSAHPGPSPYQVGTWHAPFHSYFLCSLLPSSLLPYHRLRDKQTPHSALSKEERVGGESGCFSADGSPRFLLINTNTSCPSSPTFWLLVHKKGQLLGQDHKPRLSFPLCNLDSQLASSISWVLCPRPRTLQLPFHSAFQEHGVGMIAITTLKICK